MSDAIDDAAGAALAGELVVIPTDTVYGIGTRPDDPAATARLFEAKGRPRDLEVPVLVPSVEAALDIARFDGRTERLARELWPGALTLVLPRTDRSLEWDLGGDRETLGVRLPRHRLALALLSRTGPLALTSANRSGEPTPATCDDLHEVFGEAVSVYLCEEEPLAGMPSTVVNLAAGELRVLRAGALDPASIQRLLGEEVGRGPRLDSGAAAMTSILIVCTGNVCRSPIAEGLLRETLRERFAGAPPLVASAGTAGWEGESAMPESIVAASERGADISDHVARRLSGEHVEAADLVIAMSREHRDAIFGTMPEARPKTFTLKELVRLLDGIPAPTGAVAARLLAARVRQADELRATGFTGDPGDEDISDPLGQPTESYRAVAWELEAWCGRLAAGLFGEVSAPTAVAGEGE